VESRALIGIVCNIGRSPATAAFFFCADNGGFGETSVALLEKNALPRM
jgi:hypothetical protein